MNCQKIIVDCDGGTDDALALAMLIAAHKQGKVEILGVTCVSGNMSVDNVVLNVFRTLHVVGAVDDIPVYKGEKIAINSEGSHGTDGFGDFYEDAPDISKLKEESVESALNRIVSQTRDDVTIVCLGPLTNIAQTIKIYPRFVDSVEKFLVMGGTLAGLSKTIPRVDFNFRVDPESVKILLRYAPSKVWILPLDTCLKSTITYEWRENVFGKLNSTLVELINNIERKTLEEKKKLRPHYTPCDAFLAGIVLNGKIVKDVDMNHLNIEMNDTEMRGKISVDNTKCLEPNARIIQDIDSEAIKELVLIAAHPQHASNALPL